MWKDAPHLLSSGRSKLKQPWHACQNGWNPEHWQHRMLTKICKILSSHCAPWYLPEGVENLSPHTHTHTKPHTRKKYGQLMFKRPELPNGFQRGSQGMCDQLVHGSLIGQYRGNTVMFQEPLILGGLSLQQLEAGFWLPLEIEVGSQKWELNPSH